MVNSPITLWLFNVAMEHGPFLDDKNDEIYLLKMVISHGNPMVNDPGQPSCIDVADSICNDAAGPAGPAAGAPAGSGESSLRPTLGTCPCKVDLPLGNGGFGQDH